MNTTENNKLIAEFMGAELDDYEYDLYSVPELNPIFDDVQSGDPTAKHYYEPSKMKYHTSWDWLMPVINKIINTDTLAQRRQNVYGSITPDISKSYKAVVEFIKWYNQIKEDWLWIITV